MHWYRTYIPGILYVRSTTNFDANKSCKILDTSTGQLRRTNRSRAISQSWCKLVSAHKLCLTQSPLAPMLQGWSSQNYFCNTLQSGHPVSGRCQTCIVQYRSFKEKGLIHLFQSGSVCIHLYSVCMYAHFYTP